MRFVVYHRFQQLGVLNIQRLVLFSSRHLIKMHNLLKKPFNLVLHPHQTYHFMKVGFRFVKTLYVQSL
jgi:hypothetical protein